ncbi:DciA family protein [Streptomyces sp. NPDC091217]|uniref:DciA family protein n=1 Tax=Streptomyces sp. NPDC091217 TaxID=3365975 RepID=UPI00381F5A7C
MSGEVSGVDLARVALQAALAAARKNGGNARATQPKLRTTSVIRRRGREPLDLGAAIGALVTERAWELPAAGATLRERWEAIAPELAGHVVAVGYDADSGRLTVCPESAAWATKTRLEQARVVAAANASAGRTVVRHLRILAPGSVPAPAPDDVASQTAAASKGPVKTRESAGDGYRRALAAHRQTAPPRLVDQDIARAVERQTRAMRELSAQAFPEPESAPDDAPASIETARAHRRRESEVSRAAALRRAREERAAREMGAVVAPGPVPDRGTA